MSWRALVAACGLACAVHAAHADERSVSYSTWIVSGDSVTLRYVLPAAEARKLTGSDVPVLTVAKLGDYVLRRVAVTDSNHDCPSIDQGYDLGRVDPLRVGSGLYGFEIVFRCPESPADLTLHEHTLFDRVATHVDFARIEIDGRFVEQLFTAARQRLHVPVSGPLQAAGPVQYGRLGLTHVLSSADRLCFLLAALLLVRRARDLLDLIGALAVGYGLSLLTQATGLIEARVMPVEAFVGFLIALLAALLAVRQTQHPQRTAISAGWPALLALLSLAAALAHGFQPALLLLAAALLSAGLLMGSQSSTATVFPISELPALLCVGLLGFLDGFTLPALLEPLHLAARTQAMMVGAYDMGALLAGSAGIALPAAAYALVRRGGRLAILPRRLLRDVAAAGLAGVGTFWLISRLH
jgi:hypothetical protein